jgi:hypothetical protein
MDRESVERLKFDRRLQRRRGWVDEEELESHVESLPDVSAKMTTVAELEAEEEASAQTAPATPEPAPGGFSSGPAGSGLGGDPGGTPLS